MTEIIDFRISLISKIIRIPIFKRIIPSLAIKILKLTKKNRGYFKVNNIKMFLDFLDPIDREIILYQKYEDEEVNDLENYISKFNIENFIDVGANCGYFAIKLLSKIQNLKIIAFEPNKEAYFKFKKTIEINPSLSKNITLKNHGLSDQNSNLKMKFLKKDGYQQTGGSSVVEDSYCKDENFFFGNFKIGDQILKFKNQNLCFKIDVERHEIQVLKGLQNTLKNNKIVLMIEIYEKNFVQSNALLNEIGFELKKKIKERSNYFYSNF